MLHPLLHAAVAGLLVAVLLHAALHDLTARTIPDCVTIGVAILGVAAAASRGDLSLSLLLAVLVFVVLLATWFAGLLGGGDVKLIPAATLLVPPSGVLPLLSTIAIAGGAVAVSYLLLRRLVSAVPSRPRTTRADALPARAWRAELWRIRRRGPIPYAVAIAAGTLIQLGVG